MSGARAPSIERDQLVGTLHVKSKWIEIELLDPAYREIVERELRMFFRLLTRRRKGEPQPPDTEFSVERFDEWEAAVTRYQRELDAFDRAWASANPKLHKTIRISAPVLCEYTDGRLPETWEALIRAAKPFDGHSISLNDIRQFGGAGLQEVLGFHAYTDYIMAYR